MFKRIPAQLTSEAEPSYKINNCFNLLISSKHSRKAVLNEVCGKTEWEWYELGRKFYSSWMLIFIALVSVYFLNLLLTFENFMIPALKLRLEFREKPLIIQIRLMVVKRIKSF